MTEENHDDQASTEQLSELTPLEARVLGSLMEKQRTTPDAYPLTLNALVQACTQKTSRKPVMRLEVGEVGHAVNALRDRGLIHASLSGRAERYDHKMASNYRLNRQEQALLCALMLRGPQTEGELRSNTARMAEFPDLSAVADTLAGLAAREPPLVTRLPRLPGKREERFGQLLCGEIDQQTFAGAPAATESPAHHGRVAELEAQLADLRVELDLLWRLTGLEGQRPKKP